jgi:hypothetical protein
MERRRIDAIEEELNAEKRLEALERANKHLHDN